MGVLWSDLAALTASLQLQFGLSEVCPESTALQQNARRYSGPVRKKNMKAEMSAFVASTVRYCLCRKTFTLL